MAKTISTAPGVVYCVTASTSCTVVLTLDDGSTLTLCSTDAAGQASFVGTGDTVIVSDDKAKVFPFVRASVSASGGGVSKSTVIQTIDDVLFTSTYSTAEGSTPYSWRWCHIDAANVHAGELREICLHVPEAFNTTGITDTPRYLSVYQYRNNAWKGVAVSLNACRIEPGTDMVFTFPRGTQLSANSLRLCPGNDDGTVAWREDISFVTLCSPATDGSSIRQPASVNAIPYLTFAMSGGEQRISMTDHIASTLHVTDEEREAWNNAARGELSPEQLNILGSIEYDQTYGLAIVQRDADGAVVGRLRLVVTPYAENLVGSNPMTLQAPSITYATAHEAASYTDPKTGTSYVFWGHTTDASEMAAYGITEACTWVGDPNLPLRLRGNVYRFAKQDGSTALTIDKLGALSTSARVTAGALTVSGDAKLNGGLTCTGSTTFDGMVDFLNSPVKFNTPVTFSGGLVASGACSIGPIYVSSIGSVDIGNLNIWDKGESDVEISANGTVDFKVGSLKLNGSDIVTRGELHDFGAEDSSSLGTSYYVYLRGGVEITGMCYCNGSPIVTETTLDDRLQDVATVDDVAKLLPVGTLLPSLATAMDGYLLCNGSAVSRTTYAKLFAVLGTKYGAGDGSTTFNLPDLRDMALWGANGNLGSMLSSGLPEINAAFSAYGYEQGATSGAMRATTETPNQLVAGNQANLNYNKYTFKASRSNAIYGASTVVRPPSIAVNYFIKH